MKPHLWRLDKNPDLAELILAEGQALGVSEEIAPGLFLSEQPYEPGRAAFGLGGGRVVAHGPPGPLAVPPGHTQVHVTKGPWKASGHTAEFARHLSPLLQPVARGCPLELYACDARWLLVLAANAKAPAFVTPKLPYRTSTSLTSQIARAIVNLVARPGDTLLDPVCGTGVLLVEAARIGCRARGRDTNAKAYYSAHANLAALDLSAEVERADALASVDGPLVDALVADLPYGRRLGPSALAPFAAALPPRARRWALVAHVDLREVLTAAGHPPRRVLPVPKPTFTRYVHVGGEALCEA